MTIYLDFDGTVVEHQYPKMGRINYGCMEVIKKLQDAGHEIILNTYRADLNDGTLEEAVRFLNEECWMFFKNRDSENSLQPLTGVLTKKVHAPMWDLKRAIIEGVLFIDDQSKGTPLKPNVMSSGNMVDWDALDNLFKLNNLY